MQVLERLSEELKKAMKAKDTVRLSVFRLLQASVKNRQIERGKDKPFSEADFTEVIVSAVKQRKEAIGQYEKGGREDLAKKEREELAVLQELLPAPLTPAELEAKIQESIQAAGASSVKDMGKVMKALIPQIVGRADSAEVSQRVRALLGGSS